MIGGRGTAGLVSDRGRTHWLALTDCDGRTVFGRLLDPGGGSWRSATSSTFAPASSWPDHPG